MNWQEIKKLLDAIEQRRNVVRLENVDHWILELAEKLFKYLSGQLCNFSDDSVCGQTNSVTIFSMYTPLLNADASIFNWGKNGVKSFKLLSAGEELSSEAENNLILRILNANFLRQVKKRV